MRGMAWALMGVAMMVGVAEAAIDLEWRPLEQAVVVGEVAQIGLYAVSDDAESNQPFASVDALASWDPTYLQLLGVVDDGPYDWFWSLFPDDSEGDGLNDSWDDGNAKYTALSQFGAGNEAWATPEGLLITTFEFLTLAETPLEDPTVVSTLPGFGAHSHTVIRPPGGGDVTGNLADDAAITIVPEPAGMLLWCLAAVTALRRRRS